VGRLDAGFAFDALLVSLPPCRAWDAPRRPFAASRVDVWPTDKPIDLLQKFLHVGDDRDIAEVYVQGRCVVRRGEPTAHATAGSE